VPLLDFALDALFGGGIEGDGHGGSIRPGLGRVGGGFCAKRGDSTEWRPSGVRTLLLLSFGSAAGRTKGRKASVRQSGSAFGAAVYGTRETVPFRFVAYAWVAFS
jgi:hypothetical protein